jgi:hypothetical protein
MKFKEVLTKLKTDGKINEAEFDKAIETAPDWEFPDKALQAFETAFLTIDRASTDKSVHSKLKREFLDPFDNDFKKILGVIDGVDKFKASEIDKLNSTYEKSAAITSFLPDLINKIQTTPATDEETKKELKKHKETVQELMAKLETQNNELSAKEKHWQKESETKINDFKLNMELEKLANSYKFGKAYSDDTVRKDITKVKLDSLRASYPLSLVEKDGQTTIQVLDKEGKPRFKENSNTAVTINHLLDEAFKPYIKANNVGDDDDGGGQQTQVTNRFKVSDDKPTVRTGTRTTVSKSI